MKTVNLVVAMRAVTVRSDEGRSLSLVSDVDAMNAEIQRLLD